VEFVGKELVKVVVSLWLVVTLLCGWAQLYNVTVKKASHKPIYVTTTTLPTIKSTTYIHLLFTIKVVSKCYLNW